MRGTHLHPRELQLQIIKTSPAEARRSGLRQVLVPRRPGLGAAPAESRIPCQSSQPSALPGWITESTADLFCAEYIRPTEVLGQL